MLFARLFLRAGKLEGLCTLSVCGVDKMETVCDIVVYCFYRTLRCCVYSQICRLIRDKHSDNKFKFLLKVQRNRG